MKSIYQAYTRDINGKMHYFVKKFNCYPEFKDLPPVMMAMGMHKDFLKACELADVEDDYTVQSLMEELNLTKVSGKIIPIQNVQPGRIQKVPSIFGLPQQLWSKLKWAHI